jgi:hypothetical protein
MIRDPSDGSVREKISFDNYCTCGGYAWQMNGRPEAQPHMSWCPQREEYAAWYEKQDHAGLNKSREWLKSYHKPKASENG